MNVKQLIEQLSKIEDHTLPIRVIEEGDYYEDGNLRPNFWLWFDTDIELSDKGQSGEVRLIERLALKNTELKDQVQTLSDRNAVLSEMYNNSLSSKESK